MLPKVPELWKLPEFRRCTPASPLLALWSFRVASSCKGWPESQGAVLLVMAIRQSAGGARKLQGQVSPPLPIPIQPGTTTQLLPPQNTSSIAPLWQVGGSRLYRLKCPDWRCVAIVLRAELASVTITSLATWAGDLSCSQDRALLVTEDILYQYTFDHTASTILWYGI